MRTGNKPEEHALNQATFEHI